VIYVEDVLLIVVVVVFLKSILSFLL